MKVSVFENYYVTTPFGEVEIEEWLLGDSFKEPVAKIRACADPKERQRLKALLPAITTSGTFARRDQDSRKTENYLLCVDIDGKQNPGIVLWDKAKVAISGIVGHFYSGLSVGGNGIFSIFRISNPQYHRFHYEALARDIKAMGLTVDTHCSSICSLRGASYDPNPVYTPDSGVYDDLVEPDYTVYSREQDGNAYASVNDLVSKLERHNINIAESYGDWYRICCAFTHEFGETGREFFHRVSRLSAKYVPFNCDVQFDKCLNDRGKRWSPITIRSFFRMCHDAGITGQTHKPGYYGFKGFLYY